MIMLKSVTDARELVSLAQEIQSQDALLTWREAFHEACALLPVLIDDIQAEARFVPAKVVWFDEAGRPRRLTAVELFELTGGHRDEARR